MLIFILMFTVNGRTTTTITTAAAAATATTVDHARYHYTVMLDRWTTALKEPIIHCVNFYFDIIGEWT